VIEGSYLEKRKDLHRLADDYILGSDANIRVVVGIDIDYESGKKATLSVWRPDVVTNDAGEKLLTTKLVVANQVFRDSAGNLRASPTRGLRLRLRDSAESLAGVDLQLNDPIDITAQQLYSFLELAELRASVQGQTAGSVITKKYAGKLHRQPTPPQEVIKTEEKGLRAAESREEDHTIRDDLSYKTDSTSEGEAS